MKLKSFLPWLLALGVFLSLGLIEHLFGRPGLGPDGQFHPYTLDRRVVRWFSHQKSPTLTATSLFVILAPARIHLRGRTFS